MADVPPDLLDRVRSICLALPEAYEQQAWTGVRWRVRGRTFAHVLTVDPDSSSTLRTAFGVQGEATAVTFHVPAEELLALRETGHPYYALGWGRNVMGVHLGPWTDWDEVGELLTDSYCLLAPHKLVARVRRPSPHAD
ncbi:MmcQ/YjbR family DNA-binding protein [Aeromicrobium yanjiei]|uniref:MmcQ/YjbR family DNA-binding protein n=1 Tax=Aeromicrobium yanjiei TaxID=2662028 RepID=A0A5Q2MEQ0_9ACTN|nr:MmcQ/YjbR family DNA-binding protein [Aeromicrobium yanjiei]QGG40199.1 MmcQ/YjbR family DNA-binding protein [Aeromicrobium yanjiei]